MSALPKAGETLPTLVIPVTATQIVAGAIASRDFQDVHHDKAAALEKGSPDIFMNILTTNGLVGRYVTDWSGPAARVKSIAIRLGVPNYPGDEMTMTGTVSAVSDDGEVEVRIQGANSLGDHVVGTVVLDMTREGGA